LAAGLVRLDNRRQISRMAQCDSGQSDLAIMVAALDRHGEGCIREFEGDFAFAYWDDSRHVMIAARDSFGMRMLYRSDDAARRSFASHASLLGADRPISLEYVADYLADNISRTRTPYEGVTRVAPSTYHVVHGERNSEHRYWSPYEFDTAWAMDSRTAIEQFTALFKDSIRLHLADDAGCWSQLSGGLDSSSVVSMAGSLAKADPAVPKLSGTITFVESRGIGDERAYSDAVIRDWPTRNEQIIDYRLWQDGETYPPTTDEPDPSYPLFARDQRACRVMASTGGRTLLTGVGPDHYLHGNYSYFTDWIARGRIGDSVREMYREALRNRGSFWKIAYDHAVVPFIGRRESNGSDQWPTWVHPSFARRFPIEDREEFGRPRPGTAGRHFITQAANMVDVFELAASRGVIGESLDVRYPFLHRPLVEFCLQLPPELKVRDGQHKWILREAMRGILPEEVRRRQTKGFINDAVERSYTAQHARLDSLLERSILGEMGCIDVPLARQALSTRTDKVGSGSGRLEYLLTLETWLSVRSGRWTASEPQQSATQ
jgi:asparagine synthase (glutamine-hydrolysing)